MRKIEASDNRKAHDVMWSQMWFDGRAKCEAVRVVEHLEKGCEL